MKSEFSKQQKKKKLIKIKYMFRKIVGKGGARYLKSINYFQEMGENVLFQPVKLPNDPKLIKIHNNVCIAADVLFYNHDVVNMVFSHIDKIPYQTHAECIEIFDNVFIGGGSVILGGVKIGPNSIVAAGSVVTKDVPCGTIVGGNPAHVIGDFEELHKRRLEEDGNKFEMNPDLRSEELWEGKK